ncbi:filamentous hemagglutinin N-terminal domain-containing protein [Polaromonas sp.]|uniref:beta strand repeat-containing protein n=1 Tax=Polaromonas sp. TaxID=1869339 RepID=UPI003264A7DD
MKTVIDPRKPSVPRRRPQSAVFMLKALPAALALVFANPGWAVDPPPTINVGGAAGLPVNGTVTAGDANGAVIGSELKINQVSNRAVLDWTSFNIDFGKSVVFVQPSAAAVALNRITGSTDPSQILGHLEANGTVMLMNNSGIVFGPNSTVNVGSLIATTGTMTPAALDDFMQNGHVRITGAIGEIVNHGNILATAGANGLAALIAPSVINHGVITATGGTITLAGSSAATLSLNGGLYAFAVPGGATGTQVSNAAGATLNGKTLYLGVGDAANLVSGVINLEGIQQASSAIVVNGDTVVLKSALQAPTVSGNSNTVNVSGAARIQDAVKIARSGGAVNLAAGTYVQPVTLTIDKSLTLSGAREGYTLIDARGVTGYGIQVTADDVTLKDFTLYGPTANINSAYGIKVSPSGNDASARLHDFSIRNVTIRGSGKAELDLNGVDGATIDRVTADGAPVGNDAGTTAGAGIQLTDSANVTISNSTTRNNAWGGLALYQANRSYDQQVNNITVAGNNIFNERNPVYLQDESTRHDFGTLSIAGFNYAVRNTTTIPQTNFNQYTWLQRTQQDAFNYAVNIPNAQSAASYVQGWNGAAATQNFHVGTGSLLEGNSKAMSIGSAVGAAATDATGATDATVDVYAGTYAEQLVLNKKGLTLTGHDGAKLVVPDAAEVNGISITANNVTVTGMEITGPATQSYLTYAWGNNRNRGIAVGTGVTGFVISNNSIHDLRNGILIDGNNTGSVTGNRIDNTKSAISVQYTDGNGITIAGNTQGTHGNEWGLNLHLNGGVTVTNAPTLSWQQALLGLSAANAGWSVQDQAYTSSNRTHVNVAIGGSSSAQGSALTPINSIQGGIEAVVTGGTVNVAAGTYSENVTIGKALTLDGAGSTQTVIKAPSSASGTAVTVSNASNVTLTDLQIADSYYGLSLSGTSNNVTVNRVAFNNNSYGVRNGTNVRADNFRMLNSTVTGGLVGVEAYNNASNTASFANALFENVTIDGPSYKGFYFETADNLTLRNVTIRNAGNVGESTSHENGSAIDINLKYGAFNAITLDNVVVQDSGHSSGYADRAAVVIKTRGIPGDTAYASTPASLQSVNITGGSIEGSKGNFADDGGSGLRIETLRNAQGGDTEVRIAGGTRFSGNGKDVVVGNTAVDAKGAVFVGAADGFAIEDRVTHALDTSGRGLVTWSAGNVYVTQKSGSIQRGVDAAGVGNTVNVANASFAENVTVNARRDLSFNDTRLQSLTLGSGAAGSGIGGAVTAEGAGGFLFDAPVRLLGDTTLATQGANITLNGDIQNAGGVARALRLIAGSGGIRGNVHMATGGSTASPLGQFDVVANRFSLLDTLWVKAYKINALGDVALSNHTLRAQDTSAANTLNAGGDVTGSTISQGSVAVVSAGNIAANIAGTNVVAQAQGAMDVVVTASQTATLTADTIVANITAADVVVQSQGNMNVVVSASNTASLGGGSVVANVTAPVVAVEAVNDAQVSGAASQITMNAPRGSVSGSFGQVSNTGGGLVNVNGKPQGNQTLSSNTENNRVVPSGDRAAEDGPPGRVAQVGGVSAQGDGSISLSTPEVAGEAIDSGQTVELDMSPRKRGQDKNQEKDKEKE